MTDSTGAVSYRRPYRYAFAVTSQFYYCGLPLRLDAYSQCQFNCLYCFASARGGYRGDDRILTAIAASLRPRLERAETGEAKSVLDEFLIRQQPIHFGGMSDPFLPLEGKLKATLGLLRLLAEFHYPTIISTKSDMLTRPEYLRVLSSGKFVVQFSISSLDMKLLMQVDVGTPGPIRLLAAADTLAELGIPVMCRIQPLLPTREQDAFEVIDACAAVGIRHAAVEHLKLPIERSWWGTSRLSSILGLDLYSYYLDRRSKRIGREWILPIEERLDRVLALREYAQKAGLTFGAADNDLLLLTDGDCCCSGVDFVPGFSQFFKYNYTEAIRRGAKSDTVSLQSLESIWRPKRSIGQHVNSRSRLATKGGRGATIQDYIESNWNGSPNGNSPMALYGVVDTHDRDRRGFRIYRISDRIRALMSSRVLPGRLISPHGGSYSASTHTEV